MKVVYKYPMWSMWSQTQNSFDRWAIIKMPVGAKILHCDFQDDIPFVWALVDPDVEFENRAIRIAGTGHTLPNDPGIYINTAFLNEFVFHFFDQSKELANA